MAGSETHALPTAQNIGVQFETPDRLPVLSPGLARALHRLLVATAREEASEQESNAA